MNSRDRRRQETRQALLAAADEAFCELGYARASLDAIAARAGFTKGALYAHFGSKDDLFLGVVERRGETIGADLREIADDDPAIRAQRLGAWLGRMVREHRTWLLASTEFAVATARDPALAARRRDPVTASAALFGEAAGTDAGEAVLALVNGLVLRAVLYPDFDPAPVLADALTRLVQEAP